MNKAMKNLMDQIQVKLEASKADGADKKALLTEINDLQAQYATEKALFEAERDLIPTPVATKKTNEVTAMHKPCYGKCPRCVWRWNGGCSEWQD